MLCVIKSCQMCRENSFMMWLLSVTVHWIPRKLQPQIFISIYIKINISQNNSVSQIPKFVEMAWRSSVKSHIHHFVIYLI